MAGLKPGQTNAGSFKPGHRGGGKPKLPPDVKEAARAHTTDAIATLAKIMRSDQEAAPARVRAAEVLLNRAWGTPESTAHVTVHRDVRDLSTAELLAIASGAGTAQPAHGADESHPVH